MTAVAERIALGEARSYSEQDTRRFASALASRAGQGDCFALLGDLGAGKTAFAKGFIAALSGGKEEAASPSFAIAQPYPATLRDGTCLELWHYDLYRLESPAEMAELGLDEALEKGLAIVEWPERGGGWLPEERLDIHFEVLDNGIRVITLKGTETWRERLAA